VPELPAAGERSLTVPVVVEILSKLLIIAVGVVSEVGLRIILSHGSGHCVVIVDCVQGKVIILVNYITEDDEAKSISLPLALAVEIAEVNLLNNCKQVPLDGHLKTGRLETETLLDHRTLDGEEQAI